MANKLINKQSYGALLLFFLVILAITITLSNTVEVNAQSTPTVTITGADGTTTLSYTLTQLKALQNVTGYGGFYQSNQNQINNGNWTGVSLLTLCNQVGGLTSTSNVTVTGQGVNNFTYDMVSNGINLNPTYSTYNNLTGAVQNQNQSLPITIILAYQSNGTNIASNQVPRMVIIGPEGLLMDGSGGRSVTQVNVIETAAAPTPTPSPSPKPTPTPTLTPTAKPTSSPIASPTPTPIATPTASPSPTPIVTVSPQHNGIFLSVIGLVIITVLVIIIAIVAVVILAKRKRHS